MRMIEERWPVHPLFQFKNRWALTLWISRLDPVRAIQILAGPGRVGLKLTLTPLLSSGLAVAAHPNSKGGGSTVAERPFEVPRKMATCSPVMVNKFNV